jgi:hypothetical protein
MKPATLALCLAALAMAFAGGCIVLPIAAFLVAAAAGPVFVAGTVVGIAWLARPRVRPRTRPMRQAIPAGALPRVWASAPANNIKCRD